MKLADFYSLFKTVTCGGHSLLLTVDMEVYSWGSNQYGQLGHGDRNARAAPTRLDALSNRSVHKLAIGTLSPRCLLR